MLHPRMMAWLAGAVIATVWAPVSADCRAADSSAPQAETAAERGFRFLVDNAYIPADFDQETFDQIWETWPEPLRRRAESATLEERRAMAFERYGLSKRPGDGSDTPLQYVVDDAGNWTMNCFACHGGSVYGRSYPGAPNNQFALQTLTEEIRSTKLRLGKLLTRMDLGSLVIPLGTTEGRTNAVIFGVGLMHFRDGDLNLRNVGPPPKMMHHDMDAPPWWHFHRKPSIYIDGFAERGHRGLMQFMLVRENGPEKFHQWESDFHDVYAYLMSLKAPVYDGPIDQVLRDQGRVAFNEHCARCHGTYGDGSEYPNVMVAIEEIGTDPVRLQALPVAGRSKYASSWFAREAPSEEVQQETILDPAGYVAPPLDGVWASAPYFHNGSVPTLWHVLHPRQRPRIWRRVAEEMDHQRVGLQIETVDRIPPAEQDRAARRQYFDTEQFGHSAAGHAFPLELTEAERQAVLEYLKTL